MGYMILFLEHGEIIELYTTVIDTGFWLYYCFTAIWDCITQNIVFFLGYNFYNELIFFGNLIKLPNIFSKHVT